MKTRAHSENGDDFFRILGEGLRDSDPVPQADAARLLGELGDRRAVPSLVEYVRTSRYPYKTAGLEALGRIGDKAAVPGIEDLVDSPNTQDDWYWFSHKSVRAAAAITLLRLGSDRGFPFLKALGEKGDDVFYAWFAPAILQLPSTGVAGELQSLLTVESFFRVEKNSTRLSNPNTVLMVLQALGFKGGEAAVEKLEEYLGWRSRYVRGQAACSLLQAAPEKAGQVRDLFRSAPTEFEKIKYALALGRTSRQDGMAWLLRAARELERPFERATALETLGEIGNEDSIPVLMENLQHADSYVKQCAVEALERVGGGMGQEAVAQVLRGSQKRPRLQAAKYFAAKLKEAA